jgi:hypothetical protein
VPAAGNSAPTSFSRNLAAALIAWHYRYYNAARDQIGNTNNLYSHPDGKFNSSSAMQ